MRTSPASRAPARYETLTDMGVHLRNLLESRGVIGSNRPQWFITNGIAELGHAFGHAALDLVGTHGERITGAPLRLGLTDANDRQKPSAPHCLRFRCHYRIRLTVVLAPF